jgi:hypothetical protein
VQPPQPVKIRPIRAICPGCADEPKQPLFNAPSLSFRVPMPPAFSCRIPPQNKKRERPRPSNFEKARGIPVWHTMQYASLILFIQV